MRIVAGELRGRRLRAPAGRATRPTSDRVREALFAMLEPVAGARVLDLYAGSGALGIEALSRSAAGAVFVDSDPRAIAAVRRNLADLELDGEVVRADALDWLARAGRCFDLVLIDPPYSSALPLGPRLAERLPQVLTEGARIVTESDRRHPLELPLPLLRERVYGDTRVAIHRGA